VIYLDTSWLVKLYVDEPDSASVRSLVLEGGPVLVSELSFVEFHAAVERRRREELLTATDATGLVSRFRREWGDRHRLPVSREVVERAADLVTARPLRSLDALHLASALLVAAGAPESLRFGAADERLVAAARAEGLDPLSTG
jgi:predicted nucleic acid-binding protein